MSSYAINIKVIFIAVILNTGPLFIKTPLQCNKAISDSSRLHSCPALCKPLVCMCSKSQVYAQLTCNTMSAVKQAGMYEWLSLEVRRLNIISGY